jgi:hypothetical protein
MEIFETGLEFNLGTINWYFYRKLCNFRML